MTLKGAPLSLGGGIGLTDFADCMSQPHQRLCRLPPWNGYPQFLRTLLNDSRECPSEVMTSLLDRQPAMQVGTHRIDRMQKRNAPETNFYFHHSESIRS